VFIQSIRPIFGAFIQVALLAALNARPAAALAVGWKLHLFTAGPSPISPATVIGAFTEAAFTGYATGGIAITWPTGPVNLPSGMGKGQLDTGAFSCTASGTPENILGYWVDDGANFLLGETFSSPVPIVNPGDFIDLTAIFGVPNAVQCE